MGNRFVKFKNMLKSTTQECIRSVLLPITRRYLTYLISLRLRRISRIFYTDKLFAKKKSIIGNTCAQIFMDGEGLVYVNHIQSKSQYDESFNVVVRDNGFPNTLVSYNAG